MGSVGTMVSFARYLIGFLAFGIGYPCPAQFITIRVLDQRNERALVGKPVSVIYKDERGKPNEETPWLKTDSEGKSKFKLPEPAPPQVTVFVSLQAEHWWCGCSISAATTDVAKNGLVGPEAGYVRGKAPRVKAVPGEVIILARPWGILARVLMPILAPLERE